MIMGSYDIRPLPGGGLSIRHGREERASAVVVMSLSS